MIRYYAIAAVLLFYPYRTNATRFLNNVNLIADQLHDEKPQVVRSLGKTFSRSSSGSDLIDTVCDKLKKNQKELLCDEFMRNIIQKEHGDVFESFSETPSTLPVPLIARSSSHKCDKKLVGTLNMEKRMYWCKSKRYKKKNSNDFDQEPGFFVAGSRHRGCTFAFRPPEPASETVSPVAKMEYVQLILDAVLRGSRNRSPM